FFPAVGIDSPPLSNWARARSASKSGREGMGRLSGVGASSAICPSIGVDGLGGKSSADCVRDPRIPTLAFNGVGKLRPVKALRSQVPSGSANLPRIPPREVPGHDASQVTLGGAGGVRAPTSEFGIQ